MPGWAVFVWAVAAVICFCFLCFVILALVIVKHQQRMLRDYGSTDFHEIVGRLREGERRG